LASFSPYRLGGLRFSLSPPLLLYRPLHSFHAPIPPPSTSPPSRPSSVLSGFICPPSFYSPPSGSFSPPLPSLRFSLPPAPRLPQPLLQRSPSSAYWALSTLSFTYLLSLCLSYPRRLHPSAALHRTPPSCSDPPVPYSLLTPPRPLFLIMLPHTFSPPVLLTLVSSLTSSYPLPLPPILLLLPHLPILCILPVLHPRSDSPA